MSLIELFLSMPLPAQAIAVVFWALVLITLLLIFFGKDTGGDRRG